MSTPGSGRRTPSRGSRPAGRGGPGRAQATRTTRATRNRSGAASGPDRGAAATKATRTPGPPPRLTSRAAILVLVLAVLAVSYSSLARAYLPQRADTQDKLERIRDSEANIAAMEREVERQSTPEFLEQQQRELGYVFPGETSYRITENGKALDVEAELSDPSTVDPAQPPAWWDGAWDSLKVAGSPPKRTDPLPQTKITDPEGAPADEEPTP